MSKTRLGLIGCGGMAKAHASRLELVTDRLDLTAAVDVVPEQVDAVREHFPNARPASDYHDVFDDVDAVLLALPHHLHHRATLDCLAAGKHVLVEKPMANSEQECREMIAAAEQAGRVLMVAYCMRYHAVIQRVKELLDAKTYGDVFQISIWTEQHTQYPPGHWATSAAQLGGGQLFSHGCHYIDLLLWLLGRPVSGCHVGTNYGTPWMEREGTSQVSLSFASGALGYHAGTWGAKGTRLQYSLHAHCTEGMIEAPITKGRVIAHANGKEELLLEVESGKHTQNEVVHFVDCIKTGRTPLTDGPGSLQGLRVIWRLYEAEKRGVVADLRGLGLDEV